ncbi:MAG: metallophosphoesterase family protein [Candidatus Eisenbacteria bacterium]|nr:metallophosphoesterase family protein [Candidatus Eisenbacteria bacterium]
MRGSRLVSDRPRRVLSTIAALLALFLAAPAGGGDYGPTADVDPAPSPLPDRIIQTFAGDPSTCRAVTWRTDDSVGDAFAEITPADPSPDFHRNARRIRARTERFDTESGAALCHSVLFSGLLPGESYLYRVGSSAGWSEWFTLRAAGEKDEPFRFLYLGDAQNNILGSWSRVVRAAYASAPDARFLIHTGDLVTTGDDDAIWAEWFQAGGWIHAQTASVPVVGNHEYHRRWAGDADLPTAHWRAQFTLPENGPAGMEEYAYTFVYNGVRVIVLNSRDNPERQATWLDRVLREGGERWTVVTFHHPVFSAAQNRDNKELRELWRPLFDRYGVDLVLQGHDHTYARGRNLPGDTGGADPKGPVYVVSVSGPKMYELPEERWMVRAAENTQFYQVVSVDSDTLRFEARTATGELYDAFDLVRAAWGENRLVERMPAGSPERTF